jgi:hypothetical protein
MDTLMQIPKVDLLPFIAPLFEHYVTLHRVHPRRTYCYEKRGVSGFPVIECTRHRPKCKEGDSWLYVATSTGADLRRLQKDEKLYVGSQTQDRMFRGDGLDGANFHHAEMRKGNKFDTSDTPVAFLQSGRAIEIYRIPSAAIAAVVSKTPELTFLAPLPRQSRTSRKHLGYWFEQYMLVVEPPPLWRWNSSTANRALAHILAGDANAA